MSTSYICMSISAAANKLAGNDLFGLVVHLDKQILQANCKTISLYPIYYACTACETAIAQLGNEFACALHCVLRLQFTLNSVFKGYRG
jgi:hypothetical protein